MTFLLYTVRLGNSDISIMNRPFAFRLAALLPLYNSEAAVGIRKADVPLRRREITQIGRAHV